MSNKEQVIPIKLDNGQTVYASATMLGGEEDVISSPFSFDNAISAIEGVAINFSKVFETVKPTTANVEFSVKLAAKSGKLSALLVDGKTEANIKISLKWEN